MDNAHSDKLASVVQSGGRTETAKEESEELSQDEQRILNNLQELERYATFRQFADEDVNSIVKIIVETIDWIADSMDSTDVELPKHIMDLLEYLDQVVTPSHRQKIDFSSRLGDSRISYLIKMNLATCTQV